MKVKGLSAKADRFEGANSDLRMFSDLGVRIRVIEIDHRLKILIEVKDNTTHDAIRDAIPLALQWRDRLLDWQGPWLGGGDNHFYHMLNLRHETGLSYSQLAKQLNKRIAETLIESVEFQEEYQKYLEEAESKRHEFDSNIDLFKWALKRENEFSNNPYALDHARDYLRLFKFEEDQLEEILHSGIERIQSGEDPFENLENYPIDRNKVISILRTWRSGTKHQIWKRKAEEEQQARYSQGIELSRKPDGD